jgi:hypothetical protein
LPFIETTIYLKFTTPGLVTVSKPITIEVCGTESIITHTDFTQEGDYVFNTGSHILTNASTLMQQFNSSRPNCPVSGYEVYEGLYPLTLHTGGQVIINANNETEVFTT